MVFCWVVVALLLLPNPAAAWGPVSHLAHGSEVLRNLTILGLGLQRLLRRHPHEYLYGCVGADITMAKKYTATMQAHCHSWDVGWQILDAADSDPERAFAWGYLSHLAADVYSHNHFVPTQLVVTFRARTLRHLYWEARFDSMQRSEYRRLIAGIRRHSFPECDTLVERVVARTIFSFRTNKRIFDSFLAFHDWSNWPRVVAQIATTASYDLPKQVVRLYNAACMNSINDLLLHAKKATCQAADPIGREALSLAGAVRDTLKTLDQCGAISPGIEQQLAALNRRDDLDPAAPHPDFGAGLGKLAAPA